MTDNLSNYSQRNLNSKSPGSNRSREEAIKQTLEKIPEIVGDGGNWENFEGQFDKPTRPEIGDIIEKMSPEKKSQIFNSLKQTTQDCPSTVELFKGIQNVAESTTIIHKVINERNPSYSLSLRSLLSPRNIGNNKRKETTQWDLAIKNSQKKTYPDFRLNKPKKPLLLRELEVEFVSLKKRYLRAKADCELHQRIKAKLTNQLLAQRKKIEASCGMKRPFDTELQDLEKIDDMNNDRVETDSDSKIFNQNISSDILDSLQTSLIKQQNEKKMIEEQFKILEQTVRDREDLIETLKTKLMKTRDENKILDISRKEAVAKFELQLKFKNEQIEKQAIKINYLNNLVSSLDKNDSGGKLKVENEQLKSQLNETKMEMVEMKQKLQELQFRERVFKTEITRIQSGTEPISRINLELDLEKTNRELRELKVKLAHYEGEEKKLTDELRRTKSTENFLLRQLTNFKEEMEKLNEKLEVSFEKEMALKNEFTNLQTEKGLIETELNNLKQLRINEQKHRSEDLIKERTIQTNDTDQQTNLSGLFDGHEKQVIELYKVIFNLTSEKEELVAIQNKLSLQLKDMEVLNSHFKNERDSEEKDIKKSNNVPDIQEKWTKRKQELKAKIALLKKALKESNERIEAQERKIEHFEEREAAIQEEEDLKDMYIAVLKLLKTCGKGKRYEILCQQLECQQRKITELECNVKLLEEHDEQMQWVRVQLGKQLTQMHRKKVPSKIFKKKSK